MARDCSDACALAGPGYVEQPQSAPPAFGPRLAVRRLIGEPHDGQAGVAVEGFTRPVWTARRIYPVRDAARQDLFEYMEMFYNPVRRHGHTNRLSPVEFRRRHTNRLECV